MNVLFLNSNITQMMAARELKHDLDWPDRECVAVIRRGRKSTKRRFVIKSEDQLEGFGGWHKVYLVPQIMGRNFLAYILNFCVYVAYGRYIISKFTPQKLVFGNYLNEPMRHLANKFVKTKEIIFMDEGLSTVNVLNDREQYFSSGIPVQKRSIARFIKKHVFGFQVDHVKGQIGLFSFFPLHDTTHTKIIASDFRVFRKSISPKETTECVYFLGGPFAEWGYVSKDENRLLLKEIIDFFGSRKLFYFPHPLEDLVALRELAADLGFEISSQDKPFELFLRDSPVWPTDVATYFSFGAVSCMKLFGDPMSYHFFELPNDRLRKANRNVANIYDFLRSTIAGSDKKGVQLHRMKME